jgi:hypothetical protein
MFEVQTICNVQCPTFDPVFLENHPILLSKNHWKFKFLVKNNLYWLFFLLQPSRPRISPADNSFRK